MGVPTTERTYPLRLPRQVRAALEHSAEQRQTSLNGEIVRRLEQSLGNDTEGGRIARLVGIVMEAAGKTELRGLDDAADPDDWPDHPAAWAEAINAAAYVLNELRPEGAAPIPGTDQRSHGAALAAMFIEDQPAVTAVAIHELGPRGLRLGRGEPYDQRQSRRFRAPTSRKAAQK
jgi:hypothetical protein